MTHPGIGPVSSLAFVLAIGPVTRFACSRKITSYLGLNPTEESSGGRRRLGGISKQGNTMVRWLLIETVHHAVRQDPALRQDYQRLKFRRGHTRWPKWPSRASWLCVCTGCCAVGQITHGWFAGKAARAPPWWTRVHR